MSAGYTPGPWESVPSDPMDGFECYWIRAKREFSPITRGFQVTDIASVNGPQWAEQEATARLIAAAPELVEALRGLLKLHEAHHNCVEHAAARALLRRIEGEDA